MSPFRADRSSAAVIDEGRVCPSCGSSRSLELLGEICMHFPGGLESLNMPLIWAYPKVVVCLDCGFAEFTMRESELKPIRDNLGKAGVKAAS